MVETRNNKRAGSKASSSPPPPSIASHDQDEIPQMNPTENKKRSSSLPTEKTKAHDTSSLEQKVYEVELILGKKYDQEGNISYLVKWKSWDGEPTWEPEEFCLCTDLLTEYESKIERFQEEKKSVKKVKKSMSNSKKKNTTMGIKRITRNKRLI